MSAALTYVLTHPATVAALNLGAAFTADWALGVLTAIVRGNFQFAKLPQILSTTIASTELKVIVSGFLSGALAWYIGHQGAPLELQSVGTYIITAASAAAAVYSIPTWRDVVAKALSLLGVTQLVRKGA